MSILIKIDTGSATPFFRQIIDQIIALVDSGALKVGTRLPSSRSLADKLGVNRSTVYHAYQELWSLGYLESRPGSYSTIRKRTKVAIMKNDPAVGLIDWSKQTTPASAQLYSAFDKEAALLNETSDSGVINFIPLSPDPHLLPVDPFRKCMSEVIVSEGASLLGYGDLLGYQPLREYIAGRLRLHSVSVTADEIMITSGAQNALELLVKALVRPASSLAFERPSYARALDIFRLSGAKMFEIPMDEEGMDLETLERVLKQVPIALVYTIPNFHNPTGVAYSQRTRENLIKLCEQYKMPLVEDGFEEEMKYFGRAVLPIKSMDSRKVVIYLGTFSKVLFPGLRVGWIAADRALIRRLAPVQRAATVTGNLLVQAALNRFCHKGYYDLHLKRMHRIYRQRMQTALKAIKACMNPRQVLWVEPNGGYTIWFGLKHLVISEEEAMQYIFRKGVMVLPGSHHFYRPSPDVYFRLSIAHLEEQQIEKGLHRLAGIIDELHRK
jgi:DNA-binding transcriptional MocR family regulator